MNHSIELTFLNLVHIHYIYNTTVRTVCMGRNMNLKASDPFIPGYFEKNDKNIDVVRIGHCFFLFVDFLSMTTMFVVCNAH